MLTKLVLLLLLDSFFGVAAARLEAREAEENDEGEELSFLLSSMPDSPAIATIKMSCLKK